MNSDISFEINDANKLTVIIQTERLHLQSITESDFNHYSLRLSDPVNMAKYTYGEPWNENETKERVNDWIKCWHNNDPFSALTVFKNEVDECIGHISLDYGDNPGHPDLSYLFSKNYWGNGYGKESVTTVVCEYAPELVNRHYKVGGHDFSAIVATARPDNEASVKILQKAGMKLIREEFKYNYSRYVFFKELRKQNFEMVEIKSTLNPALRSMS